MPDDAPPVTIEEQIAAVRVAVIPYRSQYAVGMQYKASRALRAALTTLRQHEALLRVADAARNQTGEHETITQFFKRRDELREALAALDASASGETK